MTTKPYHKSQGKGKGGGSSKGGYTPQKGKETSSHKRSHSGEKQPFRQKEQKPREVMEFTISAAADDVLVSTPAPKGSALQKGEKREKRNQTPKKASTSKESKPKSAKGGAKKSGVLKIISLGGLGEVGKNMTAVEYGEDIMVIDCGVAFPDEDLLGIDLVIPDVSYLMKNKNKVRGVVITHGHEDHIGSLPYVLKDLNVPVYTTRLTAGILKNKLAEFHFSVSPTVRVVEAGDTVKLGSFQVEFLHVNHSIPDACALSITTPVGVIFHTGDFKLDTSPIDGKIMDMPRIGEIGNRGVLLMMGESTNAERPGYTPSESTVGSSFETIFSQNKDKRIVIATFSSNVHRVQQIIDSAVRHKRKVAFLGRSMINVVGAAGELGYMHIPADTIVDIGEIKRYKPGQMCLITTGSQGEPMSALYRMAFGENAQVRLAPSTDLVVLSSHPIPGNEKLVGKIINTLIKNGIEVYNTGAADVHVSGHACQEELKLMLALVKPKFFMPVHGEARHLHAHAKLAEHMGIPKRNILLSDIGRVLEVTQESARFNGTVPAGTVYVDGSGVGDVGALVIRERKQLSEDGIITVACVLDLHGSMVMAGPDISSKGFAYLKETEGMMEEAREIAIRVLMKHMNRSRVDTNSLKSALIAELERFFYRKTKRSPVILPIVLES